MQTGMAAGRSEQWLVAVVFLALLGVVSSAVGAEPFVVGLVPVRNEEHLIQFCLRALAVHTDAIVVLDDRSTDGTVEAARRVAEECNVKKIIAKSGEWTQENRDETADRNALLDAGRELGGTHFIVIDADEALTANWEHELRDMLASMMPGDSLSMFWIKLWKSTQYYRTDQLFGNEGEYKGVYSQIAMTPIFRDDGVSRYTGEFIHTHRAPDTLKGKVSIITDSSVGLLHFQYVFWPNMIIKQAWYKCMERLRLPDKPVNKINDRYAVTLEEIGTRADRANPMWLGGAYTPFFNASMVEVTDEWRLSMIRNWFLAPPTKTAFKDLMVPILLGRHGIPLDLNRDPAETAPSFTLSGNWDVPGAGASDVAWRNHRSPPKRTVTVILLVASRHAGDDEDYVGMALPLLQSLAAQAPSTGGGTADGRLELLITAPGPDEPAHAALANVVAAASNLGLDATPVPGRHNPPPGGDSRGWVGALNGAVGRSAKDVLVFADGSTFVPPYFVSEVLRFYRHNIAMLSFPERLFLQPPAQHRHAAEAAVVAGEGGSLRARGWEEIASPTHTDFPAAGFASHWRWRGGAVACAYSGFATVGGFDESYDLPFWAQLANVKDRMQVVGFDVWTASRRLTLQRAAGGVWFSVDGDAGEDLLMDDESLMMMGQLKEMKQKVRVTNNGIEFLLL